MKIDIDKRCLKGKCEERKKQKEKKKREHPDRYKTQIQRYVKGNENVEQKNMEKEIQKHR